MVCFYKGQIPPNAPGGGLTTFDRLLSPNQGRFALIKVKSPTSPQGGGVSRNNDRRIMQKAVERECPHLPPPVHTHLIRWRYSQVTSGYPAFPGVEVLSRRPLVVVTGDAFSSRSNFEGCLYAAQKTTDVVLTTLGIQ